jgi:hypothetical protein
MSGRWYRSGNWLALAETRRRFQGFGYGAAIYKAKGKIFRKAKDRRSTVVLM